MDIIAKRSYYLEQREKLVKELEKVDGKIGLLNELIGEDQGPEPKKPKKKYVFGPPGPFPSTYAPSTSPEPRVMKKAKSKKVPAEISAMTQLAQAMKDADKNTKVKHVTEVTADKDAKKFLEPGKKYDIVEEEF